MAFYLDGCIFYCFPFLISLEKLFTYLPSFFNTSAAIKTFKASYTLLLTFYSSLDFILYNKINFI